MNIYIVCHHSGEYDDYSMTNVAAFGAKEAAALHAENLQTQNDRMAEEGRALGDAYNAWLRLNPRPDFPFAKLPKYPQGVRKRDLPQSYFDAVEVAKYNLVIEKQRFEEEMTLWNQKSDAAIRGIIDSHTEFPEEDRQKFYLASTEGYWYPSSICDAEDRFNVQEVEFHG